jgi:hypothetical protein
VRKRMQPAGCFQGICGCNSGKFLHRSQACWSLPLTQS